MMLWNNGGEKRTIQKRRPCGALIAVLLAATLAQACRGRSISSSSDLDSQLRAVIEQHGLTGDPSQGRELPSIDDPLAQLGMKLFFTKALGGDNDSACASCHHPMLGGGDDLSLPIGVAADNSDLIGPGRMHPEGAPLVPRNSPTTFNVALWDQVMFHDGRVESLGKTPGANGGDGLGISTPDSRFGVADPHAGDNLVEAQCRFPVASEDEMRGPDFEEYGGTGGVRLHLAARIGDYGIGQGELERNNWLVEFQDAFQNADDAEALITFDNIVKAIGAYERSQVFIDNPWKAYVEGNVGAISDSAKRGALLFFTPIEKGGAGCASCHRGDFFTDEQFHTQAIPQVGPGKEDGPTEDDDYGRFRVTGDSDDLYAFRTPSLLNVEVTGPYGHDGAYVTLEGIVRHYANPRGAFEPVHFGNYDYTQLDPYVQTANTAINTRRALAQLERNRAAGILSIQDVALTNDEISDLVDFLRALTDPCVKDRGCMAPWIPGEDDADPDGLRLRAIDQDGNPL